MLNSDYSVGLFIDAFLMMAAGLHLFFKSRRPISTLSITSGIIAITSTMGIVTIVVGDAMCPYFLLQRPTLAQDPAMILPGELLQPPVPLLSQVLLGMWLTVRWSALAGGMIAGGYALRKKSYLGAIMGMGLGCCLELGILMNMQYPVLLLACPAEWLGL